MSLPDTCQEKLGTLINWIYLKVTETKTDIMGTNLGTGKSELHSVLCNHREVI